MGSFISTSKFCELPFRGEKFINFGNTISFDKKASDEEIITTIVNENCDRIQTTKEPTENEKRFPNLAKVINQMNKDSVQGNKIVMGAALNELRQLVQAMNLRTDENGEAVLPFGDSVRLT